MIALIWNIVTTLFIGNLVLMWFLSPIIVLSADIVYTVITIMVYKVVNK